MSTCLVISLRKKTGKSGIASILTSPLKSHIRFPRTSSEVPKPESLYVFDMEKVGCDNPATHNCKHFLVCDHWTIPPCCWTTILND